MTFVVAAVTTCLLRVPAEGTRPPRGTWSVEVTAGVRHLRRVPLLALVVAAAAAIMAVSAVAVPAQYSLVTAMNRPPAFLGVLAALLGGGSVVASLVTGAVLRRLGLVGTVALGLAAYAVGTTLRLVPDLAAVVAGSVVLGFALPWVFLATLTAVQELTPDHLQGRTSAAVTLLLFGPQAPMQALGSLLITRTTYQHVYAASAVAAVVITAAVLLLRRGPRRSARSQP